MNSNESETKEERRDDKARDDLRRFNYCAHRCWKRWKTEFRKPKTEALLKEAKDNNASTSGKTDKLITDTHTLADNAGKQAKSAADQVKNLQAMVEVNRDALRVSQGSYVTVGRADGIIGDFVVPSVNSTAVARMVMYFRNTGHLPAKFNWGIIFPPSVIPPIQGVTEIVAARSFTPMTRTVDRKNAGFGESRGSIVGGESSFDVEIAKVPMQLVTQLRAGAATLVTVGAFESCDSLGLYSCRQFSLSYQGQPYDTFSVYSIECPVYVRTPDANALLPGQKYIAPCPTVAESDAKNRENDRRFQEFQKKEAMKNGKK